MTRHRVSALMKELRGMTFRNYRDNQDICNMHFCDPGHALLICH